MYWDDFLARLCLRPSEGNSLFKLLKWAIVLQYSLVSTYNLSVYSIKQYLKLCQTTLYNETIQLDNETII